MSVPFRLATPLFFAVLLLGACNGDFLEAQELMDVRVPCEDVVAVEQLFELRESLYADVPRRTQYLFVGVVCGEDLSDGVHVWADPDGEESGVEIGVACGHSIRVSEQLAADYPVEEDSGLHDAVAQRLRAALCS